MPAFAEDKAFIDIVIRNTQGEEFRYSAELAHTPELRRKGLMYRYEFSSEEAMLFLWPVSARRLFWMKNTFIPLDILFFSEAGTLFHLVHMAEPESETLHSSHRLTAMVVELKGGRQNALILILAVKSRLKLPCLKPDRLATPQENHLFGDIAIFFA